MKGFEYRVEKKTVQVAADQTRNVTIRLRPLDLPQQPIPTGSAPTFMCT